MPGILGRSPTFPALFASRSFEVRAGSEPCEISPAAADGGLHHLTTTRPHPEDALAKSKSTGMRITTAGVSERQLAPLEHAPLPVDCELLCRTRHFDYAAIVAGWNLYLAFAAQPAANMGCSSSAIPISMS